MSRSALGNMAADFSALLLRCLMQGACRTCCTQADEQQLWLAVREAPCTVGEEFSLALGPRRPAEAGCALQEDAVTELPPRDTYLWLEWSLKQIAVPRRSMLSR